MRLHLVALHLVALGALVGAPVRYLLSAWLADRRPAGTLLVNLVGSALLGVLAGRATGGATLALLGAGFCGGLTTASTFAWEVVQLGPRRGAAYAVVSLVGGIALAYAGFALARP